MEKLDKEVVQLYAGTYEKLYDRVEHVVETLLKAGRWRGNWFEGIYEITKKDVIVTVECWDEPEQMNFPIEYLYDDTFMDELKEEIRIKEELKAQKELEDKAYYAQLEQEDEIRLLKKLQKKYPDVK